jgi:hypothetical protein
MKIPENCSVEDDDILQLLSVMTKLKEMCRSVGAGNLVKVEPATPTLRDTFKVDLPCRLFEVGWGKPTTESHPLYGAPSSCTLLYALGASYTGTARR